MIYRYFISYARKDGFGRFERRTGKRIKTYEDLKRVEEEFSEQYRYEICIMYYKLIGISFGKWVQDDKN